MNEQIFRIRPYSKRELAGLYFPFTKNADTAVKNLNNLMHRNVNTQFRAYPFYKASEWMPHKKLLLNSIVF